MPGYLSNRIISLLPATEAELTLLESEVDSIDLRLTQAEGDIEDLQLNVGV